jgi:tetratricopeptide (TPR) repeat protein
MNEADAAALRDQRDFLLASLEDLERERAAGDLDDADYAALKDDYTARAAAVLRALDDAARTRVAAPRPRSWRRAAAAGGLVVVFAVLAGVLVAQSAGRRDPGETATGVDTQTATQKLNEAGRLSAEGELDDALSLYDEVLENEPDNVEALAYRGWLLTLSGRASDGLESLLDAATTDPSYPDVHAFLAVVFFRSGLVSEADRELDRLDSLDPPASIRSLVAGLRAEVDAALGGPDGATSTTAPAGPQAGGGT